MIQKLFTSIWFAVLSLLAAGAYLLMRIRPTLPSVMQDEYVYLSQAFLLPIQQNPFGNFLHSFVYGATNFLGNEFYFGVKLLNIFFLFLFSLFVVLTARKYLQPWIALLLGLGTTLGATGLYASVFMPEVMFFAFASGGIYLLSTSFESPIAKSYGLLSLSIVMIALAGLIKPHALILAIGIVVFLAMLAAQRRMSAPELLGRTAIVLFGYSAVKLLLGFLLAGEAGLTLLGASYEKALSNFFIRLEVFYQGSASASGALLAPSAGASLADVAFATLISTMTLALALAFMTMGLPLILTRPVAQLSDFQVLIISLSIVFVLSIGAFTTLVTLSGDDHSQRILGRYFEFLVPFLLIASLAEIAKAKAISNQRFVFYIIVFSTLAILWQTVIGGSDFQLVDSAILMGSFRENLIPWLVTTSGALVVILIRVRPKPALVLATVLVSMTIIVSGVSSVERQLSINSVPTHADFAGQELQSKFPNIPGSDIAIISDNRQLALVAKFWSQKLEVADFTVNPGSQIDINDPALANRRIIVEFPNVSIVNGITLSEGEGYRILGKPGLP